MAGQTISYEDLLVLSGDRKCAFGHAAQGEATPGALDCAAARLKRQRLDTDGSDVSGYSVRMVVGSQQHWSLQQQEQQQEQHDTACLLPLAQRAAATPAATPAAASLAQLAAKALMLPWQASFLLDYVHRCLDALSGMHPVCAFIRTHTKAAELACAIFRSTYLARPPAERATLLRERFLAQSLLAASLWVAVKFEATRTTTPDARIMSRITGIPSGFLVRQEQGILAALQWDLMPLARKVSAVGCMDPPGTTAPEQRELRTQLAHMQQVHIAPPAVAPLLSKPRGKACAAMQPLSQLAALLAQTGAVNAVVPKNVLLQPPN